MPNLPRLRRPREAVLTAEQAASPKPDTPRIETIEAMEMIRRARPIAAAVYADQALDVHLWLRGVHSAERATAIADLKQWMRDNEVDVSWVISRIRRSEMNRTNELNPEEDS